jgi:hypothetical protein
MRSALAVNLGDTLLMQVYNALEAGGTDDAVKPLLQPAQYVLIDAVHKLIDGERKFFH